MVQQIEFIIYTNIQPPPTIFFYLWSKSKIKVKHSRKFLRLLEKLLLDLSNFLCEVTGAHEYGDNLIFSFPLIILELTSPGALKPRIYRFPGSVSLFTFSV